MFLLGAVSLARGASPTVQALTVQSGIVGENVHFHADVSDADGNLQAVVFYVSGPGISGWQNLGTQPVTGAQAPADLDWSVLNAGVYTVRADVVDPTSGGSAQTSFEVYSERRVLSPLSVPSGGNVMFTSNGELVTNNNPTAISTSVSSGGNLILWAGGRVVLKAGFKAASGSSFWAAVDHNMNGFSDVEEATDSDGDGIPDAWELDYNLDPHNHADASSLIPGTAITYLQAYQTGKDPREASLGGSLPSGINLVLKTPGNQFLGVQTTTWAISAL